MKKLLGLLAILLLVSFPALAQNSDPVDVTITAVLGSGCNLLITPTTATWALIPVPVIESEKNEFVPMDEVDPIEINFSGRLNNALNRGEILLTTTSFQKNGADNPAVSTLVKFSFAAGIEFPAQDLMAPATAETVSLFKTSNCMFMDSTQLTLYFKNAFGVTGGNYSGVFTFQVMDTT